MTRLFEDHHDTLLALREFNLGRSDASDTDLRVRASNLAKLLANDPHSKRYAAARRRRVLELVYDQMCRRDGTPPPIELVRALVAALNVGGQPQSLAVGHGVQHREAFLAALFMDKEHFDLRGALMPSRDLARKLTRNLSDARRAGRYDGKTDFTHVTVSRWRKTIEHRRIVYGEDWVCSGDPVDVTRKRI